MTSAWNRWINDFPTAVDPSPTFEPVTDPSQSPLIESSHLANQSSANDMVDQSIDNHVDRSQSHLDSATSTSFFQSSRKPHPINGVVGTHSRVQRSSTPSNHNHITRRRASRKIRSERNISGTEDQTYSELASLIDL